VIIANLAPKYSAPDATAHPWEAARQSLAEAELYWFATVKPDGQPHVTPLIAVWARGALHICTGPEERKARNLAANPRCTVTTGSNKEQEGVDVVLEGAVSRVEDEELLQALADAYVKKYGERWRFQVADGAFTHDGGVAHVFRIEPSVAFAFVKDASGGQTRYSFDD
jgi:nitroimidazol reductase NimA-like FMN-containing flavoprotein (pyridoxamine 5'-phosphate oxidase superfamily)